MENLRLRRQHDGQDLSPVMAPPPSRPNRQHHQKTNSISSHIQLIGARALPGHQPPYRSTTGSSSSSRERRRSHAMHQIRRRLDDYRQRLHSRSPAPRPDNWFHHPSPSLPPPPLTTKRMRPMRPSDLVEEEAVVEFGKMRIRGGGGLGSGGEPRHGRGWQGGRGGGIGTRASRCGEGGGGG